jgi:hypothetical protein
MRRHSPLSRPAKIVCPVTYLASAWPFCQHHQALLFASCVFSLLVCFLLACPHTPHTPFSPHTRTSPPYPTQPCLFLPPCCPTSRSRTLLLLLPWHPAALAVFFIQHESTSALPLSVLTDPPHGSPANLPTPSPAPPPPHNARPLVPLLLYRVPLLCFAALAALIFFDPKRTNAHALPHDSVTHHLHPTPHTPHSKQATNRTKRLPAKARLPERLSKHHTPAKPTPRTRLPSNTDLLTPFLTRD